MASQITHALYTLVNLLSKQLLSECSQTCRVSLHAFRLFIDKQIFVNIAVTELSYLTDASLRRDRTGRRRKPASCQTQGKACCVGQQISTSNKC